MAGPWQLGVVRSLEDGVYVFSFNPSSRAGRWTGFLVTTPIVSLLWNIPNCFFIAGAGHTIVA